MMTRTLGMPQKNNLAVFWTLFKRGWSQTHVVSERLLDFQSKWRRADFDHDDDLDKDTKMIMKSIAVN